MLQSGRKKQYLVINNPEPEQVLPMPEPPKTLSADEAATWRRVLLENNREAFSTSTTLIMLEMYCSHVHTVKDLTKRLDKLRWGSREYRDALEARAKETEMVIKLARAMRLSNQSRYNPITMGKRAAKIIKAELQPWEN